MKRYSSSHFAGWRPLRGHGRFAGSRIVSFHPAFLARGRATENPRSGEVSEGREALSTAGQPPHRRRPVAGDPGQTTPPTKTCRWGPRLGGRRYTIQSRAFSTSGLVHHAFEEGGLENTGELGVGGGEVDGELSGVRGDVGGFESLLFGIGAAHLAVNQGRVEQR